MKPLQILIPGGFSVAALAGISAFALLTPTETYARGCALRPPLVGPILPVPLYGKCPPLYVLL